MRPAASRSRGACGNRFANFSVAARPGPPGAELPDLGRSYSDPIVNGETFAVSDEDSTTHLALRGTFRFECARVVLPPLPTETDEWLLTAPFMFTGHLPG